MLCSVSTIYIQYQQRVIFLFTIHYIYYFILKMSKVIRNPRQYLFNRSLLTLHIGLLNFVHSVFQKIQTQFVSLHPENSTKTSVDIQKLQGLENVCHIGQEKNLLQVVGKPRIFFTEPSSFSQRASIQSETRGVNSSTSILIAEQAPWVM